jgi:creatinine amidohydrolase
MEEIRLSHLRPAEVHQRLAACPAVYLPLGPLEWHGPHMPLGTDPLNAENVSLGVCRRIGGIVWPTQFWGTERERPVKQLQALGFEENQYVVGMDFPRNSLPSAYCPEEILALLLRENLRQIRTLGARLAVIINGHGAENHQQVLGRLANEFNHTTDLRVQVRIAMPQRDIDQGSIGHATDTETSLMMYLCPQAVDLKSLPPLPQPLRFSDFAIVDGPGFDGKGSPDRIVLEDPRTRSSAQQGQAVAEQTIQEVADEVTRLLKEIQ